jgi:glycosyltransferase involved in cell wall biosynthesis
VSTAVLPCVGGPFESVAGLARGLAAARSADVTVLACTNHAQGWAQHQSVWGEARVVVCDGRIRDRIRVARSYLLDRLNRRSVDVIHASGLWDETTLLARVALMRSDVPLVWSIRGMLEPWALQHHGFRKRLAWMAGQRRTLAAADVVHATAPSEAVSCRNAGLRQPVAVIPNGIELTAMSTAQRIGRNQEVRRCVYLGRLHPKKGLPSLIHAWARCDTAGWCLEIAGPDSDDHAVTLLSLVERLGLPNVAISDARYGDDRRRFLDDSDLFVCPSYSENFGNAIAEAMERSKPVITTTGTPWKVLVERDMGWWVEPTVDGLSHALRVALKAPPSLLLAMGQRCREHVAAAYSWPSVVDRMRAVYDWLLGGGRPPLICSAGELHGSPDASGRSSHQRQLHCVD